MLLKCTMTRMELAAARMFGSAVGKKKYFRLEMGNIILLFSFKIDYVFIL